MKEFLKQDLQFVTNKLVIHERHFHELKTGAEFPNGGIGQSISARLDSLVRQSGEKLALTATNQDRLT
ncbi:MAG TPA: hypothetical protein VEI95_00085, partial [Acidobacteriota bacterium]|nr:hypothetical protein [Acidobacteriota bacterium]